MSQESADNTLETVTRDRIEIVICTHNRRELLGRVVHTLNEAERPIECDVSIHVVANACDDGTHEYLQQYVEAADRDGRIPLKWTTEPEPGKSHALNTALASVTGTLIAFVDDDHRIPGDYLVSVCRAAQLYPQSSLFCGRIIPDWDGTEPAWAHEKGEYAVYPLPVPHYDYGDTAHEFPVDARLPGGGNLVLRSSVLRSVNTFSTDLGPQGHDLGGGEDSDFVQRVLDEGYKLVYYPAITQYHYVDSSRFTLRYVLIKGFQRSRSVTRVRQQGATSVPLYLWKKLLKYLFSAIFSISWTKTRFYAVRVAATFGEIYGFRDAISESARRVGGTDMDILTPISPLAELVVLVQSQLAVLLCGGLLGLVLLVKSLRDFTRTGPQVREEIIRHYRLYGIMALLRLALWSAVVGILMAEIGTVLYLSIVLYSGLSYYFMLNMTVSVLTILLLTTVQFSSHLIKIPSSIVISSHYLMRHFYPLWRHLTPARVDTVRYLLFAVFVIVAAIGTGRALQQSLDQIAIYLMVSVISICGLIGYASWAWVPSRRQAGVRSERPNILMIGADTLRSDRIGLERGGRQVAPFLSDLSRRGVQFNNCFVPVARTAPSIVSMLTGAWPKQHGIRDNFIDDDQTELPYEGLPSILRRHGYTTAAISDWCGSDMGKFNFGYDCLELPEDQWNIRYLIRQGPKDIRLFLSLFVHNRIGRKLLPEIYYLAGVPLGDDMVFKTKRYISTHAGRGRPFFLNLFMGTTHPPFGSKYPYYTLYSDPDYWGESKFCMSRLTDPHEIIRSQREPREAFDLEQIMALYDGAVTNFDDYLREICRHLERAGIADNTIILIYSDHGMDFFEGNTWGQGNSIYTDYSYRIPLLIRDPRIERSGTVDDIVRSVDIVPTLLDLAGINEVNSSVGGISIRPYLEDIDADMGLTAYAETGIWLTPPPGMDPDHLHYPDLLEILEVPDKKRGTLALKSNYIDTIVSAKDVMVRDRNWKLVRQAMSSGFRYQLFNAAEDPDCRHDLIDSHPEIAERLKRLLHEHVD